MNSQNYRLWVSENPEAFVETGIHPQKIGVVGCPTDVS